MPSDADLARSTPAEPSEKPTHEMSCRDCGAWGDALFDFLVATPIWDYVMTDGAAEGTMMRIRPRAHNGRLEPMAEGVGGVVCLPCFDRRARKLAMPYRDHVLVFGGSCWQAGDHDGPLPLAVDLPGSAVPEEPREDECSHDWRSAEGGTVLMGATCCSCGAHNIQGLIHRGVPASEGLVLSREEAEALLHASRTFAAGSQQADAYRRLRARCDAFLSEGSD